MIRIIDLIDLDEFESDYEWAVVDSDLEDNAFEHALTLLERVSIIEGYEYGDNDPIFDCNFMECLKYYLEGGYTLNQIRYLPLSFEYDSSTELYYITPLDY